MRILSISTLFFLLATTCVAPIKAYAQSGPWFKSQDMDARLIAGSGNQAALQIKLAEGWHTYWRIPGDSGLPPVLSWAQSENIESVDILWPAPSRKKEYEFNTFGYDGLLTLPLVLNKKDDAQQTKLDLNAQIMICNEICIPQRFEAKLDLDENADVSKEDLTIKAAKEKVPQETSQSLAIKSVIAAKDSIVVTVISQNGFDDIDVFPVIEEDYTALTLPAKIEVSEHDENQAMLRVDKGGEFENLARELQNKTLSVIVTQGETAVKQSVQY